MIGRRTRLLADCPHRSTDSEAHDVFEGHHPAIDNRQAGGDAACLEGLAVVATETSAAPEMECEAPTADREMAAFGPQGIRDVVTVMLQDRIAGFVHIPIPMRGGANGFRDLSIRHGEYGRPRTSGGRRTRWDRVRLNRLAGSIPVVPDIGPRRPAWDASQGDLLITPQWVRLRLRRLYECDQSRHASLMRRARSSGRFRNSREAKLFGPPW